MTDRGPPEPVIETPRAEGSSRRVSAVWLVPLIALAISLGVAWRTYSERGPVIEIVLDSAAGIEAGRTALRFREVNVGVVETIGFTDDLTQVRATVRVEPQIERFLDASAQFWVVRPSVSTQGVTGIQTVLSGVYIEAFWSGAAGPRVETFTALPRPPLTPADQPGRRIGLRAPDGGSISVGAPILFKRIAVGRIETVELTEAGDVRINAFVNAPYDAFLTTGTRFWNSSGFSINLGAGGASLNVESLVSLLQGGVGFAQVGSELDPIEDGRVFELYASETVARQNVIEDLPGARLTLNAFFDASVSGLAPGARVEYRGVTVGEVTAFQPVILRGQGGTRLVMRVTLAVLPQRLGVPSAEGDPAEAGLDLISDLVENSGLRAQLASSGLLSQSLHISLAEIAAADPATLDRAANPHPVIPTAPSETSGIAASAEGVMNRLSSLPIEELMTTFTTLLANINTIVTDEGVRTAPANLGALIADIRDVVETSGVRQTPAQIAAVLASIQAIVAETETSELVSTLAATLDTARLTIEKFGTAADGVPGLLDRASTLADRVNALPLDAFLASATDTVNGVDALIRSDGVTTVPAAVNTALAEARGLIADLRTGGAVSNVNDSLAALRLILDDLRAANLGAEIARAVTAAQSAAANVDSASQGLPALVRNLETLSAQVNELPLDALIANANATLDGAEALLAADGVDRVPNELAGSLAQVRLLIAELREGGAVDNVNATLASADQAAAAISAAAERLPALIARLDAISVRADSALATFAPGSELNRETQSLIRDLRNAAQSVNALVLALERRPNSVLFGR